MKSFDFSNITRVLSSLLLAATVWACMPSAGAQVLLGDQTIEATKDSNVVGQAEAFQTTASQTGPLGALVVYLDSTSTSTQLYLGLYADNAGHPGALLTQGSSATLSPGAWNTIAVSSATVVGGTRYWIAILGTTGGKPVFRDRISGSCSSETSSVANLSALPATWTTGTVYTDCPISAYGIAAAATGPVLSVSTSNVAMTAATGGADPAPVTVAVNNLGIGSLSYTASSDSAWLTVTPTSGQAPSNLQISASVSGLALGAYTGHITVTASGALGSPAVVTVSLTLAKPADWLMVDHDPGRSGNATDESTITSANVGSLNLSWSVGVDGPVTAQPLFVSGGGVQKDVLVVATGGNSVYALDAATGSTIWKRNFGSQPGNCAIPGGFGVTGAPLIDRNAGRVYAVSDDGVFRTISLADGTDAAPGLALISGATTNKVWGGLNKVGNYVYVATASDGCDSQPWRGQVYRVDVTGNPMAAGSFAVVPGIAAPYGGGGIWGYGGVSADTSTGNIFGASGADSQNPEGYTPYADRMITWDATLKLLGSYGPVEPNNFPCNGAPCDLDFGATPLVFRPTGCQTLAAAGNKNGNLYLFKATDLAASSQPLQILALNAANDWLGSGGVGGVPAYWAVGNMVYIVTAGSGITGVAGGVIGLNIAADCTLKVAWSTALGGATQPNSTPTVANGVVFAGEGATGMIHAYDAKTGVPLWNSGSQYGATATFAAPIVAQGHVYAGSWSNFTGGGIVGAFSLSGQTPVLAVSPLTLSFAAQQGGSNPAPAAVSVTNTGVGTLSVAASSDSSWLLVSPASGTAPQTLQVSVNVSGLAASTYTGHITVTGTGAQGSPATITVTLTVTAPPPPQPVLSVSATSLSFTAVQGGANPAAGSVNITNTGTGTLTYSLTSDSAWLTATPASGTAPQALQVSANINGLAANTYTGHLTITATGAQNSPTTVTVTLVVNTTVPPGTVLLGDQATESGVDSNSNGRAEAFMTTASASGSLTSITFYVDASSTASKVYIGLYSNGASHPASLLTQGSTTQLTKGAWNTVTVPAATVNAGSVYWLAILGTTSGKVAFRDRGNGVCKSETSSQSNLNALPTAWTSGTVYSDCPISAYGR
jgi:hypothetical protein